MQAKNYLWQEPIALKPPPWRGNWQLAHELDRGGRGFAAF